MFFLCINLLLKLGFAGFNGSQYATGMKYCEMFEIYIPKKM